MAATITLQLTFAALCWSDDKA